MIAGHHNDGWLSNENDEWMSWMAHRDLDEFLGHDLLDMDASHHDHGGGSHGSHSKHGSHHGKHGHHHHHHHWHFHAKVGTVVSGNDNDGFYPWTEKDPAYVEDGRQFPSGRPRYPFPGWHAQTFRWQNGVGTPEDQSAECVGKNGDGVGPCDVDYKTGRDWNTCEYLSRRYSRGKLAT